jgi:hypothetical protein
MAKTIIKFESEGLSQSHPWPVGLDENNVVTSGLGPDDGAILIGFGERGQYSIDVVAEDACKNPDSVVGLVPTFVKGGSMFEWTCIVAELTVSEV